MTIEIRKQGTFLKTSPEDILGREKEGEGERVEREREAERE